MTVAERPSRADQLRGHIAPDTVACARAPLRLSFCGGGTDLMPYAAEHGGLVLSSTIGRYAYATLRPQSAPVVRIRSLDYGHVESFRLGEALVGDGTFDLVTACLRRLQVNGHNRGFDLFLETYAPPGSGLGASSALVVAVLGAFDSWRHLNLDQYTIARLAYEVERRDVGIAGGMQDQYAAAFGGFNLIEFRGEDDVIVNPLRIESQVIHELEYNSVLVFTGATRRSSGIIESQVQNLSEGKPGVIKAFGRIKELALAAKSALLHGELLELGEILHEDWMQKKATSSSVTTAEIDRLYEEARAHGALGGKVSGAGGGGFMFLLCPFDRKREVVARLTELGAQVSRVEFCPDGLHSWLASGLTRGRGGLGLTG
jgi:D-glycero-alpha-D-manno-heptose-7-phosphate kinase